MRMVLVALLLVAHPAPPAPVRAEVTDPIGDAGFSPTDAPAPDLRSGSVEAGEPVNGRAPDAPSALAVSFRLFLNRLQPAKTGQSKSKPTPTMIRTARPSNGERP